MRESLIFQARRGLLLLCTLLWCSAFGPASVGHQAAVSVSGSGFEIKTFQNGAVAFANRAYVWQGIPNQFSGWQFTQVNGGSAAEMTLHLAEEGDVFVASASAPEGGWLEVDGGTLAYTDKNNTVLHIYRQHLAADSSLSIPQRGWAGAIVLAPELVGDQVPDNSPPPGTVIDYQAASTHRFVGSPSIAILPDGSYVASHDIFGPGTHEDVTEIFRSTDRGASWKPAAQIQGQFWSSLFVNKGALYILGPDRSFGRIVIRRSIDGGFNWTSPTSLETGILSQATGMHCAPTPVIELNGRIWRAFEQNPAGAHGRQFQAFVISAPVDADLLRADSWSGTNPLAYDPTETGGNWLEGNAVVAPNGSVVDILRIDHDKLEKAAVLHVSSDGRSLSWSPTQDRIDFFGGASKFTIRYDPDSKRYWSLVNKQRNPDALRNVLSLVSSADLVHWTVEATLLQNPDREKHAFQYVDWLFDGDDIIAVSRTSWNGDTFHNANYLTFHRIVNFRLADRAIH